VIINSEEESYSADDACEDGTHVVGWALIRVSTRSSSCRILSSRSTSCTHNHNQSSQATLKPLD
jgi:hypothetical protein